MTTENKTETRNLINFYELSEVWQAEARRNNDEHAEDEIYIEPKENQNPSEHALQDLSNCMRVDDSRFDGVIGVSNNSAIGVKLLDGDEQAILTYL